MAKKKKSKSLVGQVIYQGDLYDVVCNGKNHYTVSEWGTERQCGCFCKKSAYKKRGFTSDLLKTPAVDDGVTPEKSATMEWLSGLGVL
jgi:hypothetical protein